MVHVCLSSSYQKPKAQLTLFFVYFLFTKKIKVDEYKFKKKKNNRVISLNFEIRFIDSFKFTHKSLGNLVSNLESDDFHNSKKYFKDSQLQLLTRKRVYP